MKHRRNNPRYYTSRTHGAYLVSRSIKAYAVVSVLDMLRFYAGLVMQVASDVEKFEDLEFPNSYVRWDRDGMYRSLKHIRDHMRELGFPVSTRCAERFLDLLRDEEREAREVEQQKKWFGLLQRNRSRNVGRNELIRHASLLNSAFRDELAGLFALAIPADKVVFYEQEEPLFGALVAKQFPGLTYDIQEAGKCYALERDTASVYHSIRCLEAGISALSRCLGIPDPIKAADRTWGKMLQAIKSGADAKWPHSSHRMSGDGKFFEEVQGVLSLMQNPYRNSTMHLDRKYNAPEAIVIMNAVILLMKTIATRMDENGDPKA